MCQSCLRLIICRFQSNGAFLIFRWVACRSFFSSLSNIFRPWQIVYVRTWHTQNDKFYKLPYMIIFLTNTLTHTVFHFPEYVNQLWAIRRTCTLKQAVRQIIKTNNVTSFSFHVLCPYLTILNLISVSEINIQWGYLPAFFYLPLQTIDDFGSGNTID